MRPLARLSAALDLTKLSNMPIDIYSIHRPGPDGLSRVTARRIGELEFRSWVVPMAEAEDSVLDEWATFHDAMLGYPPNW
jgi:hypothetical protein